MERGARTREHILERSAQLFSRTGYFGSSLADIMRETGLEKGGIYNHFASKDELALAAFDYAFALLWERVGTALTGKPGAVEQLLALVGVFQSLIYRPMLAGGCPLLNTAVEADDAHPALSARARDGMTQCRQRVREIVEEGVARGELHAGTDGETVASVLLGGLEGAVMLTKLYRDAAHMRRTVDHLTHYIVSELAAVPSGAIPEG